MLKLLLTWSVCHRIGEAEGIVPVPSDECASVQFGEGEEVVASGETGLFPAHQLTVRENGACVSYPEAVDGSALVDCNGYGARLRNGESVKNYGEIRTTHQEVDRHRRTCVESVRKIFALPQTTGTEPVLEGEPQLLGANGKLVKLSDLGAVEYVKCDESPGIQQTVADNPKSWSTYSVSLNAEAKTVVVPTGDPAIPSGNFYIPGNLIVLRHQLVKYNAKHLLLFGPVQSKLISRRFELLLQKLV